MIYIIWAAPGEGKSFWLTGKALKELNKKNGKNVFSNYPIVDPKTGRSAYVWDPSYIYLEVTNAMILIDEGYRDVSSRNYKDFKTDAHTFFATNRHNDDDIYLIAHNPARIDVIIREMTNVFIHIKKIALFGRPLWFVIEGFLSENDFPLRHSNPDVVYSRTRMLFKKRIRDAYNTKYFKVDNDTLPELNLWSADPRFNPPERKRFILIRIINSLISPVINRAAGAKRYLSALYKKDNSDVLQVPGTLEPGSDINDNITRFMAAMDVFFVTIDHDLHAQENDFSNCFGNYALFHDQEHCKACIIASECYHETHDHD